jgi:hypothetical protein
MHVCISSAGNKPIYAGIPYRNFFLFQNFIPAPNNIYYIHSSFTFFWRYIVVSFLRSIPVLLNFHLEHSSVSIVSDYGLDDWAIGVRSPAGARDFSSILCVQTRSEAQPAPCTMGTGGPFPGAKRGRGVTLTTHPHLVPRSWMSRSYTPLPPSASKACNGTALLLLLRILQTAFCTKELVIHIKQL